MIFSLVTLTLLCTASAIILQTKSKFRQLSLFESKGNLQDVSEKSITSDGEVVKQLLSAGSGKTIEAGDILAVEYAAFVEGQSKPFARGDQVKFVFKDGSMIKGWDAAIGSMKVGEKARFSVSSRYGYGAKGINNVIPPNAKV